MKENKVYIIRTLILVLFLIPLSLSLLSIMMMSTISVVRLFLLVVGIMILLIPGYFYAEKIKIPENVIVRYVLLY